MGELSDASRRAELLGAAGFALFATAFALLAHSRRTLDVGLALGLIATLAVASRVRVHLGVGFSIPTQLALVPMLYLLPVPLVPACVGLGLALGHLRLASVGDGWHSAGSAAVLLAAGEPAAHLGGWPLLAAALAAQCVVDLAIACLREWQPSPRARVLAGVYGVDACLTAVGLALAAAGRTGFVLALPLLALFAALERDRRVRIDQAIADADELGREHARLDRAVRRIGEAFASKLDRAALLDLMVQTAVEALDAEYGRVGELASAGEPGRREPVDALAAAEEAARRSGALAGVREGRHVAIAHPLIDGGVLAVARRGRSFGAEERALLGYLARQTAVAMENLALHDVLRDQATRDELTGLANHRGFQQALAHEVAVASRTSGPLALALLDLDDFKAINDTHGHQQGDLVLQRVAAVLSGIARTSDEPARYGGEELAVILPGTDLDGAFTLAEAIRVAVEGLRVELPDGGQQSVTVSIGVSALEPGAEDAAALIEAADVALYEAKRAGKNRIARGAWVRDGRGRFARAASSSRR